MKRIEVEIEQVEGSTLGPIVTFRMIMDGSPWAGHAAHVGDLASFCEADQGIVGATYRAWREVQEEES